MNQLSANSDSPGNASRGRRIRPLDWARPAGAVDLVEREMRVQVRRRRLQWVAGAGAAVLALLVADLAWQEHSPARSGASASAAKFVTSPRRQVLPDGSVVVLKSGTDFALDYSEATRRVWLRRGEAHFQIAKNPHRPFLVMARGVEVRAVGTAFSVELARTKVDVMVTEGRIAVKHHPLSGTDSPANSAGGTSEKVAAPAASAISVDAGHLISIDTEPGRAVDPTVQSVLEVRVANRAVAQIDRVRDCVGRQQAQAGRTLTGGDWL